MVALVMTILYMLYTVACATDPMSYKGLFFRIETLSKKV